jgi:hypothetical protein
VLELSEQKHMLAIELENLGFAETKTLEIILEDSFTS